MTLHSPLRRVPWTCRWGRFGGPVDAAGVPGQGFVFWVCAHPNLEWRRLLDRGACETCPNWEPAEEFVGSDREEAVRT